MIGMFVAIKHQPGQEARRVAMFVVAMKHQPGQEARRVGMFVAIKPARSEAGGSACL